MSTKLGTLTLDLVAKIGNFVEPIKKAERQTESSFSNMQKSVNKYGAVVVAGAAAVGAGVFAMANEYTNAARELQIFASISNTTTQEFQKMAVGAQTMGISQEKLSDQLKDFNEKLGEFITIGSGGAVDFFEQIAIKTEGSAVGARKLALEMQKLSGPQALQLYVDKLQEAGVTQQQMSFYLESMASDTTNLIPLLKDGGEGFKYWADAAERAGTIMDESAIAKANELRVQMDLLNLQVQGVKNQFIQGFMPALVSVGDGLSDVTLQTNMMSDAGETLGEVFKGVAATGMGVYAVVKMLSNAMAGLAVDAVNAKKMVDKSAEGQGFFANLPGVKITKAFILGTANARFNQNSGVQMAAQDNAQVADDVANSINRIYSDAANKSVAAIAKIQNSQNGMTKGSDEWIKKQNEAAKAASNKNKALAEQNRLLEQQAREKISYDYLDDFAKFAEDKKRQIAEIQKANFGPQEAEYLAKAKARYEHEEEMYLRKITEEIHTFKWSEEQKLDYHYETQRIIVSESGKNNDEIKELKLKALDEQYAIESTKLKNSQQKQLLEAKRNWMTAEDYASQYYALVREEILNTAEYSPEMKEVLIRQANSQQGIAENAEREQVWGDYQGRFGINNPYQDDIDLLKDARDQMLITEEQYQQQRLALQMSYGAAFGSDFAGMMMGLVDESSSAYAILGGIQKGAALFSVAMNSYAAISAAWASAPFPYNLPAVGMATMETGLLQAAVQALSPVGMAHNGIDNIPKEGTWLLDGGERVLNPNQNKDLTNYLSQAQSTSQQSSQLNQVINNVVNWDDVPGVMAGQEGQKVTLNIIRKNRTQIKALLGVQ